jgi:HAD superfamily hydrolase (TIGR01509 family)
MKKAALFDMDGLLVDTESLSVAAAEKICKDLGIDIKKEEVTDIVGVTAKKFYGELQKNKNLDHKPQKLIEEHNNVYESSLENGVKAYPGAKELPRKLKEAELKIALVSGSSRWQIDTTLKNIGMENVFDLILSCDDITKSKPSPQGFLVAAEKLGVKPEECIVFEDSMYGIEAGKRAGMTVVGVVNDGGQDIESADIIINTLADFDMSVLE